MNLHVDAVSSSIAKRRSGPKGDAFHDGRNRIVIQCDAVKAHLRCTGLGCQSFHHSHRPYSSTAYDMAMPSDANPDHTWIDRDEALRRIFAQELLFVPGTKPAHSHSAFGVLAAVIEIAAEQTYADGFV